MDNENLSLEELQESQDNKKENEDSTQDENDESQDTSDTQSEKDDTESDQETENQEPSKSEDNPQESQGQSNQSKIREQIATLKQALEYLESQNEQGLNQEIEIAKLREILQQIEQLRREVFIKQEQKLEESEAYFALVGVKVALLEKLKAQDEC